MLLCLHTAVKSQSSQVSRKRMLYRRSSTWIWSTTIRDST